MPAVDHNIDANLKRAAMLAEHAVTQGVQFVLFPEMMATGSYVSFDTWDQAEPSNGKSVQWLKSTSRRLHVWLGAGFLEASGSDFYDTFVLTSPSGEEAGRVRKQIRAGPEAYFFPGRSRVACRFNIDRENRHWDLRGELLLLRGFAIPLGVGRFCDHAAFVTGHEQRWWTPVASGNSSGVVVRQNTRRARRDGEQGGTIV